MCGNNGVVFLIHDSETIIDLDLCATAVCNDLGQDLNVFNYGAKIDPRMATQVLL